MPPNIFILGATGYIGGDVLFALVDSHSEYQIACLVRNSDKGAQVASRFSKARLVYGELDNVDLLEREAKKAHVVLNCASSDHDAAARALIKGLASREVESPGFYIHTSGVTVLSVADIDRKIMGEAATKVYDDWDGILEVVSLPDHAPHRAVEKIVMEANSPTARTAVVCGPTIYGQGRGPGNKRSDQVPEMARCTLERKQAFQVGSGKNCASHVHLHDLSELFIKLVEAALEVGGKATWGKDGYYFAENGEHVWGYASKLLAKSAHKQGLLASDEVVTISEHEADTLMKRGSVLWGANTRCHAIRARKLLGWSPKKEGFDVAVSEAITHEATSLGLLTGHAAKVAG